jgi:hypothetical protein
MCKTWGRIRIRVGVKMENQIRMPIHNTSLMFLSLSDKQVYVNPLLLLQAVLGMDILCQAKSGMGKTAVFVLATLQQIEPVDGQVSSSFTYKKKVMVGEECKNIGTIVLNLHQYTFLVLNKKKKNCVFYVNATYVEVGASSGAERNMAPQHWFLHNWKSLHVLNASFHRTNLTSP